MADEIQTNGDPVEAAATQEESHPVEPVQEEIARAESAKLEAEQMEAIRLETEKAEAARAEAAKIESSKLKAPQMEQPVMEEAILEAPKGTSAAPQTVAEPAQFPPLEAAPVAVERDRKMDLLLDLTLPVAIELGRTNLQIRDILDLRRGSVVEFEKLASEPVDVIVNGKKMAEGEVVVIEKHFGIRITNLIETSERVKSLGK